MRKPGLRKLSGSPKITANKGESVGSNTCCLAPKPSPLSLTLGCKLWWLASKVIHYNRESIMIIKQGGLWSINQAMVSRVCWRIDHGKLVCWAFRIYSDQSTSAPSAGLLAGILADMSHRMSLHSRFWIGHCGRVSTPTGIYCQHIVVLYVPCVRIFWPLCQGSWVGSSAYVCFTGLNRGQLMVMTVKFPGQRVS